MFEVLRGIFSKGESFEEKYDNSYIHPIQGNGEKRKEYAYLPSEAKKTIKKMVTEENEKGKVSFNKLELVLHQEIIGITLVKRSDVKHRPDVRRIPNPKRPSPMYGEIKPIPKL